ncbi:response regulator [bacterium]|nr:response regulator [bacterium]
MIRLLLVSPNLDSISGFFEFVEKQSEISVLETDTGAKALDIISVEKLDLVIADEDLQDMTCLEFVKKMVMANPMVNCAVISSMPDDKFHEATEGMGILTRLSPAMDEKQLKELILQVQEILRLSGDGRK